MASSQGSRFQDLHFKIMKIRSSRGIGREVEGQSANRPETTDPSFATAGTPWAAPKNHSKERQIPRTLKPEPQNKKPQAPNTEIRGKHTQARALCAGSPEPLTLRPEKALQKQKSYMACGPAAAHSSLPQGYFRKSAYPQRQTSPAKEGTANSSRSH